MFSIQKYVLKVESMHVCIICHVCGTVHTSPLFERSHMNVVCVHTPIHTPITRDVKKIRKLEIYLKIEILLMSGKKGDHDIYVVSDTRVTQLLSSIAPMIYLLYSAFCFSHSSVYSTMHSSFVIPFLRKQS